jgi:hypothetical protein
VIRRCPISVARPAKTCSTPAVCSSGLPLATKALVLFAETLSTTAQMLRGGTGEQTTKCAESFGLGCLFIYFVCNA